MHDVSAPHLGRDATDSPPPPSGAGMGHVISCHPHPHIEFIEDQMEVGHVIQNPRLKICEWNRPQTAQVCCKSMTSCYFKIIIKFSLQYFYRIGLLQ